ncbi:MAG: ABC transporter permease [Deinococcus sp.]
MTLPDPVSGEGKLRPAQAGGWAWLRSPSLRAVLTGLLVGALIALLAGQNPLRIAGELFRGALLDGNLSQTLNWSIGLVGMTLVAAIPLRGGLVNLGGDGQLVVGGLVAALVALYLPLPGAARTLLAVLAAMLSAGGYAALAALGQTLFRVPLLITSLLLSYPARGVASYLVRFPLKDPASGLPETARIAAEARIPQLLDGTLEAGILVIGVVAVLAVVLDRRSVPGFELRLRGLNPRFVQYAGTRLGGQTLGVMLISGALAGLVGALLVLGSQYRFTDNALISPGYTYAGLMAALLAGGAPLGAVLAGFFFAALQIGGFAMERATGVPRVLTQVLQAVIILALALRSGKG